MPLVLAWRLGRKRHLRATPVLIWLVSGVGSLATITLCSVGMLVDTPWVAYSSAFAIGASAGVLWVMWGERLASHSLLCWLGSLPPTAASCWS